MLKILPIILFFYAHGPAYYSSIPAYYSNLLPIFRPVGRGEQSYKYGSLQLKRQFIAIGIVN